MKKIIFIILVIIILFTYNKKSEPIIPDNAIRFRIIASSNTIEDQNVKIQVRNEVQNKLLELTKNSKSIEETRKQIKDNLNVLDNVVKEKLKALNYDKSYKINYGYNYFPNKEYKGIKYKSGNYESLVVTLGKGKGDNFWCVLFPPLCLLEAEDSNNSNVEYKFFVKELINKYFK